VLDDAQVGLVLTTPEHEAELGPLARQAGADLRLLRPQARARPSPRPPGEAGADGAFQWGRWPGQAPAGTTALPQPARARARTLYPAGARRRRAAAPRPARSSCWRTRGRRTPWGPGRSGAAR
jgi:hypothetical protein